MSKEIRMTQGEGTVTFSWENQPATVLVNANRVSIVWGDLERATDLPVIKPAEPVIQATAKSGNGHGIVATKRHGRPKGSKNRPKTDVSQYPIAPPMGTHQPSA